MRKRALSPVCAGSADNLCRSVDIRFTGYKEEYVEDAALLEPL
jgi:hypothetical protein